MAKNVQDKVREFFAALEAMDIPRFLTVWADDGVQEMPYAPSGFPNRLEGKAAIEKQYVSLPTAYASMSFPLSRLVTTDEPGVVVAEFQGSIVLKAGGQYDNRYVGVFEFRDDGLLARYTEYFDPFVLLKGFPGAAQQGPDGARYVLEKLPTFTDGREWAKVRELFADDVDVDYTSVAGGTPGPVKADDLIAGWTQGLGQYRHTKHNFSPAEIALDGHTATATFTGQATHVRETKGKTTRWSCGGDYGFRLARGEAGWKITATKFDMQWEQGGR